MVGAFVFASALGIWLAFLSSAQPFLEGYDLLVEETGFRKLLIALSVVLSAWWFNLQLLTNKLLKPNYFSLVALSGYAALFSALQPTLSFCVLLPLFSFCFGRMLHLSQAARPYWLLTDIGLIIGLGMYIDPYMLFLMPILWVALIYFGSFNLRTAIIPLLSTVMAIFLVASIRWFFTDQFLWPSSFMTFKIAPNLGFYRPLVVILPVFLGLLLEIVDILSSLTKGKVNKRQATGFMLSVLILVFVLNAFSGNGEALYLILCFPLAFFQANYLNYQAKWWLRDLVFLMPWLSLVLYTFL